MKKNTFRRLAALFSTAVMAVSCGTMTSSASEAGAKVTLTDASGVAGSLVAVDLVLDTDGMCNGYNFDIEFDDALKLNKIEGTMASEISGNTASVVNFTGMYFSDDVALTTLIFELPEDAAEGETYDVNITKVADLTYDGGSFENPVVKNATITALESAKKSASGKSTTNYMVYVGKENGVTVTEVALRGDANGDGKVNFVDVVVVAKKMISAISLTDKQEFFADVDGSDSINFQDLVAISRYGLVSDKSNAWEQIFK